MAAGRQNLTAQFLGQLKDRIVHPVISHQADSRAYPVAGARQDCTLCFCRHACSPGTLPIVIDCNAKSRATQMPFSARPQGVLTNKKVNRDGVDSEPDAIRAISSKIGCHYDTLRAWLRRYKNDVPGGVRAVSTDDGGLSTLLLED